MKLRPGDISIPVFWTDVRVDRGDEVALFPLRCGELLLEWRVATAAIFVAMTYFRGGLDWRSL